MRTVSTIRLLFVLSISTIVPACQNAGGSATSQPSGPEAHRLVAAGATLLDVRTAEEFADGHLPGAINVPVDELRMRLAEVPANRPVVVYCASGARSAAASEMLRSAGRQNVHNLGQMSAWGS